jgi:hypothetical protein
VIYFVLSSDISLTGKAIAGNWFAFYLGGFVGA